MTYGWNMGVDLLALLIELQKEEKTEGVSRSGLERKMQEQCCAAPHVTAEQVRRSERRCAPKHRVAVIAASTQGDGWVERNRNGSRAHRPG